MEGEERKGVCRATATVASTDASCTAARTTLPGNSRETFLRYLQDLKMHYINSYAALICRVAMYRQYLVYNEHVVILQYFINEYQ